MTNPTPVAWIRKIRGCENEVAAQLVLETLIKQARADALREAAESFYVTGASIIERRQVAAELRRMADEELKGENDA